MEVSAGGEGGARDGGGSGDVEWDGVGEALEGVLLEEDGALDVAGIW